MLNGDKKKLQEKITQNWYITSKLKGRLIAIVQTYFYIYKLFKLYLLLINQPESMEVNVEQRTETISLIIFCLKKYFYIFNLAY